MARRQSNTLSVLVWFLGLLGCAGYINYLYPYGFFPLVLPLIFWILGSKFTKSHCQTYFNGLLTAFIIHVVGLVINFILDLFKLNIFNFTYLSLLYFSILCLVGFFTALNHKRYKPELTVHVF